MAKMTDVTKSLDSLNDDNSGNNKKMSINFSQLSKITENIEDALEQESLPNNNIQSQTNQRIHPPVQRPMSQQTQQPPQPPDQQTINQQMQQPLQPSAQQTMNQQVQQPPQPPVQQPINQQIQQPLQPPVQQTMNQQVQQPLQPSAQQTMNQQIQQPLQPPVQQPINQQIQQPLQPPVQQPIDNDDEVPKVNFESKENAIIMYHRIMKKMEIIQKDLNNNVLINPDPLLKILPTFCKFAAINNHLLVKTMSHKRDSTWFISHSINVATLCVKISTGLSFNTNKQNALALTALLHDLGMTKINKDIVNKHGKLSKSERIQVENHPQFSIELLQHLSKKYPFLIKSIYQEHERNDGEGYPQGIKGDQISPFAKIIHIADNFEALVHDRNQRPGYKSIFAIQKIIQGNGSKFDPKTIKAFIDVISIYPVGSKVMLNTGETALVQSINKKRPVRPIVKILTSGTNNVTEKDTILDLEKEPLTYITMAVDSN